MVKIIICVRCKRERKHYARGLCASCYTLQYRQTLEAKARHAATEKRRRERLGDEYRRRERERNKTPRRIAWKEKYTQSQQGKEANRRGSRNNRRQYPQRNRARQAVRHEVKMGRMPKAIELPCNHCEDQATQYHHHKGYAEEFKLDVIPLCRDCHLIVSRHSV